MRISILFLDANPPSAAKLALVLDEEHAAIARALREPGDLDLRSRCAARLDEIKHYLNTCVFETQTKALLALVDRIVGMDSSIPAAAGARELPEGGRPQLESCTGIEAHPSALAADAQESRSVAAPVTASPAGSKVDIGILTIRDDEFRAVLDAFPSKAGIYKGADREYTLRHADAGNGERYTVAVLRQVEQGNGEAQDAARALIDDLAPKLVLVVGIASGLPSDDVMLGDVVVSTRIQDFTVEARKTGQEPTYAAAGGPIAKALAAAVANLAGREDELGDWTAALPARPPVTWTRKGQLYGPAPWQRELRAKLEHHHGKGSLPRAPIYVAGTIASSDRLVKDPALLFPWITTARDLCAVEMESGGAYRAARERCPMLAIRGISDIIGLKRVSAWAKYACASAAAFTRAFLRTRPVDLGSPLGLAAAAP